MTRLRVGTFVTAVSFLGAPYTGAQGRPGPAEQDQRVLVIVGQYAESDPLPQTSEDLAAQFNEAINDYYMQASNNVTSFDFVPVPGVCEFDYTYEDTAPGGSASLIPATGTPFDVDDDPQVMIRELIDGIAFADEAMPDVFETTFRVIVVVNQPKRNRATPGYFYPFPTSEGPLTFLSAAIIDIGSINEEGFPTVSHELGHQLGLPDLYNENAPPEFVNRWCEMANDTKQEFSAYSRLRLGWLPPDRVLTITPGTIPNVDQTVRIGPPNNTAGQRELVGLNVTPVTGATTTFLDQFIDQASTAGIVPYSGFNLEARPISGLDAVLPSAYEPGVVISEIRPLHEIQSLFAQRPMFVQPRTGAEDVGGDAAWRPEDPPFTDNESGVSVDVISANADGSFDVNINWQAPPRPNVVAADILLDGPDNEFDTFWHEGSFGDPVATRMTVAWDGLVPTATVTTTEHRLRVVARNDGTAPAPDARGRVFILEFQIPVLDDLTDIEALMPLRISELEAEFGIIEPGTSVEDDLVFEPPLTPFMALVALERSGNELAATQVDNVRLEPFALFTLSPGSPYPPLDLGLDVTNLNDDARAVWVAPLVGRGIPRGWDAQMDRTSAVLRRGASEQFRLRAQVPPSETEKPGALHSIDLASWMNYGDSFIPSAVIPIHVSLRYSTALSLSVSGNPADGKVSIEGRLTAHMEGSEEPLGEQALLITLSGSDGSNQEIEAQTNAQGDYSVSEAETQAGVQHAAIAHFAGDEQFAPSDSELVTLESGEEPPQTDTDAPARPQPPRVRVNRPEIIDEAPPNIRRPGRPRPEPDPTPEPIDPRLRDRIRMPDRGQLEGVTPVAPDEQPPEESESSGRRPPRERGPGLRVPRDRGLEEPTSAIRETTPTDNAPEMETPSLNQQFNAIHQPSPGESAPETQMQEPTRDQLLRNQIDLNSRGMRIRSQQISPEGDSGEAAPPAPIRRPMRR